MGWMAKSKVVLNYKLEHTNKELDERLTSALMLALLLRDRVLHRVAPSKRSSPLLCLHYCSFHLMFSPRVTSMLLCLTCLHDIPAKQGLGCPPCLSFACGLIKDVGGASCDASWCLHG
jgi:hypothetical protein